MFSLRARASPIFNLYFALLGTFPLPTIGSPSKSSSSKSLWESMQSAVDKSKPLRADNQVMAPTSQTTPTFVGYIATTHDALILFEACLGGHLTPVARRPIDRERAGLIKSGNTFIFEEHSSGIKRWTDGIHWSPSRLLGNFLIYRELDTPFQPGEKRRSIKRGKSLSNGHCAPCGTASLNQVQSIPLSGKVERSLVGSLTTSYGFKEEGLVKKTIGVMVGGVSHYLVSYYSIADVLNNKLITPSKDPTFQHITLRLDLARHPFRSPIVEANPSISDDRTSCSSSYRATLPLTPCISNAIPSGFYSNFVLTTESGGLHDNHNVANRSIFQVPLYPPMLQYTNPQAYESNKSPGPIADFKSYQYFQTSYPNTIYIQQHSYGSETLSNHVQHRFFGAPEPLLFSSRWNGEYPAWNTGSKEQDERNLLRGMYAKVV